MHWCCSFKSYGDLVILCNYLRKVDSSHYGLLAGSHLLHLLTAIKFDGTLRIVDVGERVPAIFDIKKYSYTKATYDGILLRAKMQSAIQKRSDTLVFDTLGVRQRFLAWPIHAECVAQGADNIYLDYSHYFGLNDGIRHSPCDDHLKSINSIYLFPDSRLKTKELPTRLILDIANENRKLDKNTILIKIGKPVDLPQFQSLQIHWIDGFDQLVEVVTKADLLVTADSLPAHLAEYFGIPVFVFSPVQNNYWMPLSCFNRGLHSEFESMSTYQEWLNTFKFVDPEKVASNLTRRNPAHREFAEED